MEQYLSVLQVSPFFSHMEILFILHCIDARVLKKPASSFLWNTKEAGSEMELVLSGSALILQENIWGFRRKGSLSQRKNNLSLSAHTHSHDIRIRIPFASNLFPWMPVSSAFRMP